MYLKMFFVYVSAVRFLIDHHELVNGHKLAQMNDARGLPPNIAKLVYFNLMAGI